MKMIGTFLKVTLAAALLINVAHAASGQSVVESTCNACHKAGVLNAPKTGNAEDWAPRIKKGVKALVANAIAGFNTMPPRGGNSTLSDEEVKAAVEYLIAEAKGGGKTAAAPQPEAAPAKSTPPPAPKAAAKQAPEKPAIAKVNSFNRLMAPPSKRNPAPPEDGVHDPENDGTHALQPPKEAFGTLPKANSGNRIDWVAALAEKKINPRFDRLDPAKTPMVLDLNIVREVKGSMPDVVYPHKQHTEWLDCSNCHPAIFIPKKGANQISMAGILMGQQCGVCHGKVAFPVAECRKCHSKAKDNKKGR
jgi:c(7)-type cytochrome triheme protein